jgi:hypothetical protein
MEIKWTDVVQAMAAMTAAITSIGMLLIVNKQLRQANRSQKQSYHVSLYSANAEIDKIFVNKPELRPDFYDNKELDCGNLKTKRIIFMALNWRVNQKNRR